MKPIPGYEGYAVTEDGRVFSLTREWRSGPREIKQWKRPPSPYWLVGLGRRREQRVTRSVHYLVAVAYLGPRDPSRPEVRHLDGDPNHNHYTNLAWGTRQENMDDMRRHGTSASGVRNGMSALTPEIAATIKARLSTGATQDSLAREFGVAQSTISRVKSGWWD